MARDDRPTIDSLDSSFPIRPAKLPELFLQIRQRVLKHFHAAWVLRDLYLLLKVSTSEQERFFFPQRRSLVWISSSPADFLFV
jgi:hypothetical protein